MTDLYDSIVWLAKLLLAAILGGAIGFERESHGQSAGLRTNLLVAMGSCLMMMLSLHMEEIFHHFNMNSVVRLDPGRIASYAIASMGFLGAGAIIKGRGTVRGLTTAAGLWLVTGIGLSIGAGYVLPAVYTTLISLIILYNLRFLKYLFLHDIFTILSLTCPSENKPLKKIREILARFSGMDIRFVNYHHNLLTRTVTYRFRLCSKEHIPWGEIVTALSSEIPGLSEIAWEESDVP
ncbi:MgtC/SapB family protein [Desulforhabdus amnigena]|jgi:putative Mg2+ transporter-C (MgtC) family protein|uniref:Magnesium transporter MgtC n=1 Tax=Desulforhabdus amnigena TaxID=40218 RepID=A0A9W6CVY9_9BACT|nr:MgtC/SapB family protein [Desulforhabdus amnigena]NLJ29174.1 MgtC/SapB family protein [Deltaproteobacteria bacterium]GLI32866.1 magnesium transporter MgtC [Desulforhabdus amnigena]